MVAAPGDAADATPVVTLIGATAGADDTHVPPVVAFVNVTLVPWHADEDPATGAGTGFTAIAAWVTQPVGIA